MKPTEDAGLSLSLARHVTGLEFTTLPASTVNSARRALLDAIGVISAASGLSEDAQPFIHLAMDSGGTPEASILGTGFRVPAARAALANGAMSHALDFEDAFDAAPVHPNASLIPAALALAQASREPLPGSALIAAIVAGCDISCRLGLSLRRPLEEGGWYPPPILAAMGAVAGSARLLSLTPQQLLDAWSLMLLQNSCSGEIIHSADSTLRAVREAFPAQAAVDCVRLAKAGIRGFAAPFEGRAGFYAMFAGGQYSSTELLRNLGDRWFIDELSFKPWPSCRGTHAAIECALQLRSQHAFDLRHIHRIIVEGGPVQAMLAEPLARKRAPLTAIDAKFSLPWTIALALVRGTVNLESFDSASLADPALRAVANQVEFRPHPQWTRDRAASGSLEIHLSNAGLLRHAVDDALGSPSRPLHDSRLTDKFLACLARAARPLTTAQAQGLASRILALENEPDIGALISEAG